MTGAMWVLAIIVIFVLGMILHLSSSSDERKKTIASDGMMLVAVLMCFVPLLWEFPTEEGDAVYAFQVDGSYDKYENGCWELTPGTLYTMGGSSVHRSVQIERTSPYDPAERYYRIRIEIADPAVYLGFMGGRDRRNLDSTDVREDIQKVTNFWLDKVLEGRTEEVNRILHMANDEASKELFKLLAPELNEHLQPEGLVTASVEAW